MEYIREWWDVAWQWLLGAWQWLLEVWQWLLALPWGVWASTIVIQLLRMMWMGWDWVTNIPAHIYGLRDWFSDPTTYSMLGDISTVIATIWLIANGHEYVFQNRLDRLAQLHENVQKLKRAMLSLQRQNTQEHRDRMAEARKMVKNHYFDYSMFLVEDKAERAHLRHLIEKLDRSLVRFSDNIVVGRVESHDDQLIQKRKKVSAAFRQMKALIHYTEMLIDRRPWYAQLFHWLKNVLFVVFQYFWKFIMSIVRGIVWCLQPLWRPVYWVWGLASKAWKHRHKVQKAAS